MSVAALEKNHYSSHKTRILGQDNMLTKLNRNIFKIKPYFGQKKP